jgi:hypothetical protein
MDATKDVDASSLLAASDDVEAVCYLCLDGGVDEADQPLRRDCLAVAQMPDLSTSRALLDMQKPKVCRHVI